MKTATKERTDAERAQLARRGVDRMQEARRKALQEVDALATVALETGEVPDLSDATAAHARAEALARLVKRAEPVAARLENNARLSAERLDKERRERERRQREEHAESLRAKAVLLLDRLAVEHGQQIPVDVLREEAEREDVPDTALSEVARDRGWRTLGWFGGNDSTRFWGPPSEFAGPGSMGPPVLPR